MVKPSEYFSGLELAKTTSLSHIFEEEPVSLQTFISDTKFLGENWKLSPIQERAVRHIEHIYYPDLYPLMAEEFGGYWAEQAQLPMKNLLTLQWGKGSGKDHVCRIASLRVAYLLLCLKNPQEYFAMSSSDSIHLLNIAVNAGQANRAFFKPLRDYVKKGWFKDRAEPIKSAIQYDKNIEAISGHSDAESQEGLNILLGVADEIDAFRAQGEMVGLGKRAREASTSAESILKMLKGSASTRFPDNYKRVAISYPRYLGSTIQRLTDEAVQDIEEVGDATSIYFVSGPHATWEVNPRISGPEKYASDYRKDPDEARSMYECKPSRATDAYFRNMPMFRESVSSPDQPLSVTYEKKAIISNVTGETVTAWTPTFHFSPDFRPKAGANYAMHGDLAVSGDRAGIAMSHVVGWEERIETVVDDDGSESPIITNQPIVHNDFTISFASDKSVEPAREIQISWARELCYELIKRGFRVTRFTFDGFQSVDSIQNLERHGIESERVSLDRDDSVYKNLRDVAYTQRLTLPFDIRLFNELEALSRIDGKVDHPPHGSKDMADALAGSVLAAIVAGGSEADEIDEFDSGGYTDFMFGSDINSGYENNLLDLDMGGLDPTGVPLGMKGFGNGYF